MELLLLFAFAALFAIAFNFAQPKALGYFPSLAANFWSATAVTAVAVIRKIIVGSLIYNLLKKGAYLFMLLFLCLYHTKHCIQ